MLRGADALALGQDLGAAAAVDRAVDAAAAEERMIRGVHDRVGRDQCQVALGERQPTAPDRERIGGAHHASLLAFGDRREPWPRSVG